MNPTENSLLFTVDTDRAGMRADAYVASVSELSRSAAARLMEQGNITRNGAPLDKKVKLCTGDIIVVTLPAPEQAAAQPENIPLHIVHEDDDIIVINKPVGMVVHPAAGNESGTLVNALLYHCGDSLSGIGGVIRPGIVHRIDKETSGLIAVAKNDAAHLALSAQLKDHSMGRIYDAIVLGNLKEDAGTIDAPIGRHPIDRKKMAILRGSEQAKDARTHYRVTERYAVPGQGALCRIECRLETGRTHQIRVHMASVGHPLLGDSLYGGGGTRFETAHRTLIHGQCLHAGQLHLIHPVTGKEMDFYAPLPTDTVKLLEILRRL
ncbi:MAG: RluA family pseudouridine synthase [Clostridia bacterium]|nr:RluA family pseudouridine synthase [Clostridia bacterium]